MTAKIIAICLMASSLVACGLSGRDGVKMRSKKAGFGIANRTQIKSDSPEGHALALYDAASAELKMELSHSAQAYLPFFSQALALKKLDAEKFIELIANLTLKFNETPKRRNEAPILMIIEKAQENEQLILYKPFVERYSKFSIEQASAKTARQTVVALKILILKELGRYLGLDKNQKTSVASEVFAYNILTSTNRHNVACSWKSFSQDKTAEALNTLKEAGFATKPATNFKGYFYVHVNSLHGSATIESTQPTTKLVDGQTVTLAISNKTEAAMKKTSFEPSEELLTLGARENKQAFFPSNQDFYFGNWGYSEKQADGKTKILSGTRAARDWTSFQVVEPSKIVFRYEQTDGAKEELAINTKTKKGIYSRTEDSTTTKLAVDCKIETPSFESNPQRLEFVSHDGDVFRVKMNGRDLRLKGAALTSLMGKIRTALGNQASWRSLVQTKTDLKVEDTESTESDEENEDETPNGQSENEEQK